MTEFHDILTRFVQIMERLVEERGFKPLHGRVLACLFLSKEPKSQQSIAEWTGYSVSAVSRALEQLMSVGSVQRFKKPKLRTYEYGIGISMAAMFFNALARWLTLVQDAQTPLSEIAKDAKSLEKSNLTKDEALEAKLLAEHLQNLVTILTKAQPLFEDIMKKLKSAFLLK